MSLTPEQGVIFKADAEANFPTEVAAGNDAAIAEAYNQQASPNFWVFKTMIPPEEYAGAGGLVWTEVDTLTPGKARIFEWMTGNLTRPLNAADPNQRQGVADAFAGATNTLNNFAVLRRRLATRAEELFATGTGSTGSPGTMTFEGTINANDVALALRPPA
jgi:hypothetical protein